MRRAHERLTRHARLNLRVDVFPTGLGQNLDVSTRHRSIGSPMKGVLLVMVLSAVALQPNVTAATSPLHQCSDANISRSDYVAQGCCDGSDHVDYVRWIEWCKLPIDVNRPVVV